MTLFLHDYIEFYYILKRIFICDAHRFFKDRNTWIFSITVKKWSFLKVIYVLTSNQITFYFKSLHFISVAKKSYLATCSKVVIIFQSLPFCGREEMFWGTRRFSSIGAKFCRPMGWDTVTHLRVLSAVNYTLCEFT